ncbi:quinone oxidoreductase [Pyrus ussuriensis x Pyrus communis]|uniref:Probable quinone oxidoreductase n=1 Tax=Pyrus ussuriensis x Pyrus communis TaxID=2448454 RepID=A0A5N5F8Y7_9ROSA|nr:quinone oxidoreductase [Pyrus ussuriensis x Pyrus communis]
MPFSPGMEACGVVTVVGPGVTGRRVGDLVAYVGTPMGSYAEEQILPENKVVPVPPSIDPIVAASILLKGMTAQVEPGHTVLVHAAAGGVGSLLCQWANALGAIVIGTVSTKEKTAQAKDDGCRQLTEITSDNGVDVVYDSVGKDTFQGSLACLKTRGYMVSFGKASGAIDPVSLSALAAKSVFLTRPALFQYTAARDKLLEVAAEVFANVASGVLCVRVNHKYALSHAAQAHADLENRKTSGSAVLIIP